MPIRLNDFEMPKHVVKDDASATPTFGRFTAEPFEIGYARTIGNSLRRVLLSSIEGWAISSVRITGAAHEFCSLPGVREDVTEIVFALKKTLVKAKVATRDPILVHVAKKGPCTVTAADLAEANSAIEVLNPAHHICTVNETGKFEMEVKITRGRGFCQASWDADPARPDETPKQQEIGVIPLDRIYSPVARVNFEVSNCRVGQQTDYEKLALEITTDGRVDPDDALVHAADILRQHLDVFVGYNKDLIEDDVAEAPVDAATQEDLRRAAHFFAKEALRLNPYDAECRAVYSESLLALGETDAALAFWEPIVEREYWLPENHDALARILLRKGFRKDGAPYLARAVDERALVSDPALRDRLANLASLLAED